MGPWVHRKSALSFLPMDSCTHGPMDHFMSDRTFLESVARHAMQQYGLEPEFPAEGLAEASSARATAPDGVRDLRNLPWSSIDNDESRDLDQLEVCDGGSGSASRVLVAIPEVDRSGER